MPINQGTVKAFILLVALLIFVVVLLVMKVFGRRSIRSMLAQYEKYFVFSYGLVLVLLVLVFLIFFVVNN